MSNKIVVQDFYHNLMNIMAFFMALFSIGLFINQNVFNLSPEIKLAITFLSSLTVFIGAHLTLNLVLKYLLTLLSFALLISGIYYLIEVFSIQNQLVFALTVFLSVLIFGLAYISSKYDLDYLEDMKPYIIGFLLVILVFLFLYDVRGRDLDYTLTMSNTSELENDGNISIGQVVAVNNFQFSREFRPPELTACLNYGDRIKYKPVFYEDIEFVEGNSVYQNSILLKVTNDTLRDRYRSKKIVRSEECSLNDTKNSLVILDD